MWPNPRETADLVIFFEEIFNGKLHFLCSGWNCVCPGYATFYELKKCYIDEKWRNVSSFADEYLASMDAILNVYDTTSVYFANIMYQYFFYTI